MYTTRDRTCSCDLQALEYLRVFLKGLCSLRVTHAGRARFLGLVGGFRRQFSKFRKRGIRPDQQGACGAKSGSRHSGTQHQDIRCTPQESLLFLERLILRSSRWYPYIMVGPVTPECQLIWKKVALHLQLRMLISTIQEVLQPCIVLLILLLSS